MMLLILALVVGLESMRPVEIGPSPAASEVLAPMTKKLNEKQARDNEARECRQEESASAPVDTNNDEGLAFLEVERDWKLLSAHVKAYFPDKPSAPLCALALEFAAVPSENASQLTGLLARIIDAAFLAQLRLERNEDDPMALEALGEAARALRPYLDTRKPNERWQGREWERFAGPERASAVRKLIARSDEARSEILRIELDPKRCAFFAHFLVNDVHRFGLAPSRHRFDGEEADFSEWLFRAFERASLYGKEAPKAHLIAAKALEATGIERADAHNWVNGASRDPG